MKRFTAGVLGVALVATAGSLRAQTPQDSVLAVVNGFFAAMEKRDTVAMLSLQLDGATMYAVSADGDTVASQSIASDANIRALASLPTTLVERIWEPAVQLRGALATVWAPYDFHESGRFTHCGIDAVTLVRARTGWKIAVLAFTMEPTGCAPSPLGPLPGSGS